LKPLQEDILADLTVTYHKAAPTATIRFNRPHRFNAINQELLRDLSTQLARARNDAAVQVVILTGNERAFCAGEDLKETTAGKDMAQWIAEAEGLQDIQRQLMLPGQAGHCRSGRLRTGRRLRIRDGLRHPNRRTGSRPDRSRPVKWEKRCGCSDYTSVASQK
jgi:hypothetical protein